MIWFKILLISLFGVKVAIGLINIGQGDRTIKTTAVDSFFGSLIDGFFLVGIVLWL